MRIHSDPDFLYLVEIDESRFEDPQKRSVLKEKVLKLLKSYGEWPWSIEIEFITNFLENYMASKYTDYFDI